MTNATETKRPTWATCVSTGFFMVGFGAFITAIGLFASPGLIGMGSALVALGVMVGSFGGYGYFVSYRPKD